MMIEPYWHTAILAYCHIGIKLHRAPKSHSIWHKMPEHMAYTCIEHNWHIERKKYHSTGEKNITETYHSFDDLQLKEKSITNLGKKNQKYHSMYDSLWQLNC